MEGKNKGINSGLQNVFKTFYSILNEPQLTRYYVKGFLRGDFSIFDTISIKDSVDAILFSKKEGKYYRINLETGERKEISSFDS